MVRELHFVAHDLPSFHYETNSLQEQRIQQWFPWNCDNVSGFARLETPNLLLEPEQRRGVNRCGLNDLKRGHAGAHVGCQRFQACLPSRPSGDVILLEDQGESFSGKKKKPKRIFRFGYHTICLSNIHKSSFLQSGNVVALAMKCVTKEVNRRMILVVSSNLEALAWRIV
jgi:hypothetical protein